MPSACLPSCRTGGIVKSAEEASDTHVQDQFCLRIIHDVSCAALTFGWRRRLSMLIMPLARAHQAVDKVIRAIVIRLSGIVKSTEEAGDIHV